MDRRQFVLGLGAASAGVLAGMVRPQDALAHDTGKEHKHMDHKTMKHHQGLSAKAKRVLETARVCLDTGSACIAHCIDALGEGDTSLKKCLQLTTQMREVVQATATVVGLATADDRELSSLLKTCAQFCRACAQECKKHEKHAECKACMDACNDCEKACRDLA